MPKEKSFDQDVAVQICVGLFSETGYSATGIQQIVEATEVNRSSLYATFKGKDPLFLRCLKNSIQVEKKFLEGLAGKQKNVLKVINVYLRKIEIPGNEQLLIKNAYAEFSLLDSATKKVLKDYHTWKIEFWRSRISAKRKSSGITKKVDDKTLAVLIDTLASGMLLTGKTAGQNKDFITGLLKLIKRKKS